jgi:ABC-type multidrug transport system ATPase subunit/pSer/pThr/pTyr-binding forkhead associated (FHA) protein
MAILNKNLSEPSNAMIITIYENGKPTGNFQGNPGQAETVTIGNMTGLADLKVNDSRVSRIHAQILKDGSGQYFLVDLNSTNGTYLNGNRILANTPIQLKPADFLALGSSNGPQIKVASGATTSNLPPKSSNLESGLMERLKAKQFLTIGRSSENDVLVDSNLVSRHHATLKYLQGGTVSLTDHGSTNGTFLNGKRVSGTVNVGSSDEIIIGRTRISLGGGAKNLSQEIAIRTVGLKKEFGGGKVGLQPLDIEVRAGSLLAIMGPSGCGKSTLLKCLTGESPGTHGKVYLHNLEITKNYDLLKTLIGYVPQDDIVHKELTVEQALFFAAKLRLEKPSMALIEQKISEVLDRLRIPGIRQSPISNISGGQRKRVSIAMELLTDPLILFLDEPTSPLDPQTIEEFLNILENLSKGGTTVVMVTHKPEDLEFMDEVVFLAEGGHIAYHGKADAYKDYFGARATVEVYAQLSKENSPKWVEKAMSLKSTSQGNSNASSNPQVRKRSDASFFWQSFWLSARYLRIKTNNRWSTAIFIGQAPIIALLMLLIFDEVTSSVPFILALSAVWFGASNSAREIVGEMSIYRRERMYNLRIGPYLLSKLLVLALFAFVQALLFSTIIYIGFQGTEPSWMAFGASVGWIWLLTLCATSLGLFISAVSSSLESAMTIVPLVLIPQVLLAGVVQPISSIVVEFLSYLTPIRWGNEGMMLIQDRIHVGRAGLGQEQPVRPAIDILKGQFPELYSDIFHGNAYTIGLDAVMLLLISGSLLLFLYFAMKWKDSIL